MVPNARFTELLSDIEPSKTTTQNASGAHNGIRSHLEGHKTFSKRLNGSFLAGSYARDTSIRPQSSGGQQERPDVDIIIETNFTMQDHPEDVLKEVRRAIEDRGNGYEVKRVNKRSVRVETWQAEMDIVPVFKSGDAYRIPCRDAGTWLTTNPPQHTIWSSGQNTSFKGRFKPLVKLLKWWRRQNVTTKRPKGIVLEVLVSKHAPTDETHYGEAFAKLLENIHAAYATYTNLGIKPTIPDPALPANDILAKVTVAQWKDFIEKVRVHADYARRAQKEDDLEKATNLWRKVFGDRFKASSGTPAKATTASSFATASAATSSTTAGYAFPNNPVTPPAKPRGFA